MVSKDLLPGTGYNEYVGNACCILKAAKRSALTLEQLAQMDVHLSIGDIKCVGVADDDDEEGAQRLESLV